MREISLHIMDIVQNSITAEAKNIIISIDENIDENYLKIVVKDDGKGIRESILKEVEDPFTTTRTTRKVGLGIPLLKNAAKLCGGDLSIKSRINEGTEVMAWFNHDHVDRMPIGRITDTLVALMTYPGIDYYYVHRYNDGVFEFDTKEIKKIIGDEEFSLEILNWAKEFIDENLSKIGVDLWG